MYASEFLRNKKRAMPKVVSPTPIRDAGLWTQVQRNRSAAVHVPAVLKSGTVAYLVQPSGAANVLAQRAGRSICCRPGLQTTQIVAPCCTHDALYNNNTAPKVGAPLVPVGFYGVSKPECCPVNLPQPVPAACQGCPTYYNTATSSIVEIYQP